ncbi:54S ribosomal protein L3 mitochondrial [Polyrhizophydium stewartii]|uniref:Large ribosomal subunit protein mL44 n=1 Tax=Polyrhizophydium stewartii TaxID=2732419 RepID=A0ABR4NJ33_9FUNG|nr:hypothetical protein HK105_006780 [Polyrhizophydium stewartii]
MFAGLRTLSARSLQKAQLAAFSARSGISFDNPELLWDALTHKSYSRLRNENSGGRYSMLGEQVLKFYATEFVLAKYPQIPAGSASTIIDSFTSTQVLSSVGKALGVQMIMRWKGSLAKLSEAAPAGEAVVRANVTQALIGAIYQHKGAAAARAFVHAHFLSRAVDLDEHLQLFITTNVPRALLAVICKRLGKPSPVARLMTETGRLSSNPIFVVGMYSGIDKIGEGYGSSLRMAETKAVRDALMNHYRAEVKDMKLPSDISMDEEDKISFFRDEQALATDAAAA